MNTVPAAAGASPAGGPHRPDRASGELWLRFLSGPDIDALGLSNADIVAAVEDAVRAHGEGRAVVEPRVHLVPDPGGAGHFNVLRGHLPDPGVSGVKVVFQCDGNLLCHPRPPLLRSASCTVQDQCYSAVTATPIRCRPFKPMCHKAAWIPPPLM